MNETGLSAAAPRKPSRWRSILMLLSVVGPGIITANADNDVGGIWTYSQSGAIFGYSMLWLLLPVTVALIVTQEMCARMGAVTGKGLADLIRENFGVKVTFWVLILFVLGDLGNTAAEFAGVAEAAPIFASYVPHAISWFFSTRVLVPLAAAFVFVAITRGNYRIIEKVFFVFCSVYLAYVVSGIVVHPPWGEVVRQTVAPHFTPTKAYLFQAIAVIGTTISPWMQFYIQSAVVEKGVRIKDYPYSRVDVITGALVTDVIAYFIIVASAATIYVASGHGVPFSGNDAGDIARALEPLAGKWAALLFAIGLLNAAIFTASILPLSTAYYVCEAFGFESGVDRRFREAPIFYTLYLGLIVAGSGSVMLMVKDQLSEVITYSQVLNGVLLPVVLVLMLLLINNRALMGRYVNGLTFNVIAWATVVIVGLLTLVSTAQSIFPALGS